VEGVYGLACWTLWSTFFQIPIGVSTLSIWGEWCPSLKKTLWVIWKKQPLYRWLAYATFPLLINICSDYPTFLFVCKICLNICEVDLSGLGLRVSSRLGGYISWFYIDCSFLCCCYDFTGTYKIIFFCSFGVGPWLCLGMNLAKLEISLFVHFMVTKYK
jgi:hypothetical protein